MREKKFRVWRVSNNTMYPPATIWQMNLWECDFTDNIKIMQYTGLKDKNGKEIYEGDFLQVKNGWGLDPQKVWWSEMNASWNVGPQWYLGALIEYGEIEIIGNIYEKPEEIIK